VANNIEERQRLKSNTWKNKDIPNHLTSKKTKPPDESKCLARNKNIPGLPHSKQSVDYLTIHNRWCLRIPFWSTYSRCVLEVLSPPNLAHILVSLGDEFMSATNLSRRVSSKGQILKLCCGGIVQKDHENELRSRPD